MADIQHYTFVLPSRVLGIYQRFSKSSMDILYPSFSFLFSLIFLNIIVFSGYWSYLVTEYFQLFPPTPYVIAGIHFIYVYVIIIQYIVTAINLHKQLYFRSLKNNNNDKKRFHFPFFYPFFESLPLC